MRKIPLLVTLVISAGLTSCSGQSTVKAVQDCVSARETKLVTDETRIVIRDDCASQHATVLPFAELPLRVESASMGTSTQSPGQLSIGGIAISSTSQYVITEYTLELLVSDESDAKAARGELTAVEYEQALDRRLKEPTIAWSYRGQWIEPHDFASFKLSLDTAPDTLVNILKASGFQFPPGNDATPLPDLRCDSSRRFNCWDLIVTEAKGVRL